MVLSIDHFFRMSFWVIVHVLELHFGNSLLKIVMNLFVVLDWRILNSSVMKLMLFVAIFCGHMVVIALFQHV